MNQIIINTIKNAMCNIHINDQYPKYFIYDDSSFILFYYDFIYNFLYDITSRDVIFE